MSTYSIVAIAPWAFLIIIALTDGINSVVKAHLDDRHKLEVKELELRELEARARLHEKE